MSQVSGRPCPACGTTVPAGQRFCSNCGTDLEVSRPASQYGGPPPQNYPQGQPVPPYAQSPYGQQQQQQYQQPPQKSNPVAEALAALGLLFFLRRYRPGYQARRQSSGCCGCLVALIILLAIFGTPAYFYYRANPRIIQQIQQNIKNSSNSNNGTLPTTQPPITTATINQTVSYAGVDITILSVQQATAFLDDTSSVNNGMVRVNIKEVNTSDSNANYFFSDSAHLILPDKSSVALVNEMQSIGPAKSITRNNWLDFAVPTSDKINQLTLLLGTPKEAQISIPLTGKADLATFQPKMATLNIPISYWGLNWTLKTATSSLSIGGTQATTGMHYIVLSFNVDNPTSVSDAIGFPEEYMRLKSGDTMNPTINTTLPTTINANTTGVSGTVTFLMPGNTTAFTLIFLARPGVSTTQINTDFKI